MSFNEKHWPEFADTWIENWPSGLAKLSYSQIGIPLNDSETHALGLLNGIHRHCFNANLANNLDSLEKKLNDAIQHFPEGAFIRLGSRSPKDTLQGVITGCKAFDGQQAIRLLTSGSSRIAYDLRISIKANYQPWIFVRQWKELSPDTEFRCFMQQRQLIGVSQYFHKTYFPRLNQEPIRKALNESLWEFFTLFSKHCPIDDVVFDIEINFDGNPKITLIEINPFHPLTEACLFSWDKYDFDGSVRVLEKYCHIEYNPSSNSIFLKKV